MQNELLKLRDRIDSIDDEILKLILKRVECVREVGELKNKNSSRIYVPERENSIFRRVWKEACEITEKNEIEREELASVYTEIISFCRAHERVVSVNVQNDNCFFIAYKIFGSRVEIKKSERENIWEIQPKTADFLIVEADDENLAKAFNEKTFIKIITKVDFLGKNYIILGKDPNGCGFESYTGFLMRDSKGKVEFFQKNGCISYDKIVEEFSESIDQGGELKFLGYYETRTIS